MSRPSAPDEELVSYSTRTYVVGRFLCRLGMLPLRPRYEGLAHVPATGGVVVASNHLSYIDIPLIANSMERHVCFVARDTLAHFRPLGWLMRRSGAVLVRRGVSDRTALRAMVAHVEQGDCVAIFPEGTRSTGGRLGEFRAGVLMVARGAAVPIVPAGIRGTGEAWGRDMRCPLPRRVAVRYGPPLDAREPDALERLRTAVEGLAGDGSYASLDPVP